MAEYRLSPAAQRDLDGIFDYSTEQWGIDQAVSYTATLKRVCTELAAHPKRGRSCGHLRTGYRLYYIERHAVYYRIEPFGVAIIRILHQGQDADRHL